MAPARPRHAKAVHSAHLAPESVTRENERVAAPKITITCDCGEQRKLDHGESYTCSCGRTWSTTQVPAADYARIVDVDRRYKRFGWALFAVLSLLILGVLLTRPFMTVVLVPLILLSWFIYGRPVVRRRHYRAVAELTKTWKLRPQNGSS